MKHMIEKEGVFSFYNNPWVFDEEGTRHLVKGLTKEAKLTYNIYEVVYATPPEAGLYEQLIQLEQPVIEDGVAVIGYEVRPLEVTSELVNQERDRRIDAGVTWNGKAYQSDEESRNNVAGAATSAAAFMAMGGSHDEVYWAPSGQPFAWLAQDNTLTVLTPAAMISFGNAMMQHKAGCIFASRTLKDMSPIPSDFYDDVWWP